ncbi:snoRNA binding protein [Aureococcus anophagefferens]|nr:snoRNA binding protein [Aureococcus anophagefferens]
MSKGETLYVLHETASGYALFDVVELDEVASLSPELQKAMADPSAFSRIVKLKAFQAFSSAEMALENINAVAEHSVPDRLRDFLEQYLPAISAKKKKKASFKLGVVEPDLGKAIAEATGCECRSDDVVRELIRGAKQHMASFVKFNPASADNMIIQSIGLLDTLDKDINTFSMRVREWYSWHFPELRDLVRENYAFARAAACVGDRASFLAACEESSAKVDELAAAVASRDDDGDDGAALAASVVGAAKISMGMECSAGDMANIMHFTARMVALATYRAQLGLYLGEKMAAVAPNLSTLVGESVGARLISKAGSLSSLAKCPASTVQILGAEKALFRALKKKGNTPKYGLIYHSTFIGRAAKKNKGRISRYLANKCAIASRIDAFADELTTKYGEQMRAQVEERLAFFDTGATPRRNLDVMTAIAKELKAEAGDAMDEEPAVEKKKKKKRSKSDADEDDGVALLEKPKKKKKKKSEGGEEKKEKKKKKKYGTSAPPPGRALSRSLSRPWTTFSRSSSSTSSAPRRSSATWAASDTSAWAPNSSRSFRRDSRSA